MHVLLYGQTLAAEHVPYVQELIDCLQTEKIKTSILTPYRQIIEANVKATGGKTAILGVKSLKRVGEINLESDVQCENIGIYIESDISDNMPW